MRGPERLGRALGARPWLAALPVALLVLVRVWSDPSGRLAGSDFLDTMGTQWFYESIGWALSGRSGLLHTDMLFHPWGKELFLHTGGNLVDAALAWPLRALLGPILGYNAWILVLLLLNAYGAARLCSSFRVGPLGQGLAAVLLTLSPFVLVELEQGRPTQALLVFLALGLVGLRERRPVLAGVCLALSGWTYWYLGLMGGLVALAWLPLELWSEPDRARAFRTWALAGAVTLLGVAPAVMWMGEALAEGSVPGLLRFDGLGPAAGLWLETVEGDSQSMFVVDALGRGGALSVVDGALRFTPGAWLLGPGQIVAALGLLVAGRRRGLPLLVLVVLGAVFAAGPAGVEAIWRLLLELDLMRRWWWPMRAFALVSMGLTVAAGLLVHRLRGRPRLAWGLGLALTLAWSWGRAPLPAWTARPSRVLTECLRQAPEGAVIDLPLADGQTHLWDQVAHGKPQLGGMLSQKAAFGSGQAQAFLTGNPFAAALVAAGDRLPLRGSEPPAGRQELLDLGYRYVLVRVDAYTYETGRGPRSDWSRVRRALVGLLGSEPILDEESPRPVALWTVDGGSLSCQLD